MKKLSLVLMFSALGLFSLGCEPKKSGVIDDSSDHMTADSGEEKPKAPAADAKPAAETKPEEKPEGEAKPEEKPAEAPKP